MTENQKLWNKRMTDWEQSGISQRKYCTQEGISFPAFQYWRKKLHGKPKQFVEIKVSDSIIDNKSITINLPNGICLKVNQSNNPKSVKELIRGLKELP